MGSQLRVLERLAVLIDELRRGARPGHDEEGAVAAPQRLDDRVVDGAGAQGPEALGPPRLDHARPRASPSGPS